MRAADLLPLSNGDGPLLPGSQPGQASPSAAPADGGVDWTPGWRAGLLDRPASPARGRAEFEPVFWSGKKQSRDSGAGSGTLSAVGGKLLRGDQDLGDAL